MKIVFVSAEVSPYSKSGGLADVAGSLPKEFVKMGQEVKVKVISVSPEGKISLSMKQAEEPEKREERRYTRREREPAKVSRGADSFEFHPRQQESLSFEDMRSKFKQTSDEKLSGMKKTDGNRRTAQNRRKPQ